MTSCFYCMYYLLKNIESLMIFNACNLVAKRGFLHTFARVNLKQIIHIYKQGYQDLDSSCYFLCLKIKEN
jgi:hypothetical protein